MRPKGFRPGVMFRSRYGKYRLVLKTDAIILSSDGKGIFVSGSHEDIPGTICFENYEYIPENKETYDAIAKAWNKKWGRFPDNVLTIQDSSVDVPQGLSPKEIWLEGLQRRQAEGKLLPNPGIDFWEVDPEMSSLVNPLERERPGVSTTTRSTVNRA